MAFSKANRYEADAQRFNELFRAVSHPARQKILHRLNQDGPCIVKALSRNHPISKATLSFHLKTLRDARLIRCEEKFPFTLYELNWEGIEEAKRMLIHFFDGFEKRDGNEDLPEGEIRSDEEDEGLADLD